MKDINELKADISFWTDFYEDDCRDDYDCFSWASNKAYLDMNRTMTFRDIAKNKSQKEKDRIDNQRKDWRDKGTQIIKKTMLSRLIKIIIRLLPRLPFPKHMLMIMPSLVYL